MGKDYLKIAGNIHLSYFIEAADILGIKYTVVIPRLTAKFEADGHHWFINNTVTPLVNSPSSKLARTKRFASKILEQAGLPVPTQQKINKEIEAIAFFGKYKDIVLKPNQNYGGKGVSILPKSEEEVLNAYNLAKENDKFGIVLAEEYIKGDNYRALVLGDRVISFIKRIPAHVIGNGNDSISKLIESENAKRKEKLLMPIEIDNEMTLTLASNNQTLETVPENGMYVQLRSNANMTTGGTTEEIHDSVNQYYKDICIKAVKELDMEYGGVDLITPDITQVSKCAINEINFNPGLRIHYKVSNGEPQKVAIEILRYIRDKYNKLS